MNLNQSLVDTVKIKLLNQSTQEIFMARLDQVHPFISGNKWYKLKLNIENILRRGNSTVLTFGGAFSNHIAATAAACKEFNLKSIGIIRGEEVSNPTLEFAKKNGMKLIFVSREEYKLKNDWDYLNEIKSLYDAPYIIPEGGSNFYGINGCTEILRDINKDFDYVCSAMGTGATIAGITLGLKSHQTSLGFSALKGGDFLHDEVRKFIKLVHDDEELITHFLEHFSMQTDYHFGGYAKYTPELIDFINLFYKENGIKLDPIYTGKMVFGINDLLMKNKFEANSRILLMHTGGLQGIQGFEERYNIQLFN